MLKKGGWTLVIRLAFAILILPSATFAAASVPVVNADSENSSPFCEYMISTAIVGDSVIPGPDGYTGEVSAGGNRALMHGFPPDARDSILSTLISTPVEITLDATDPDADTMIFSIVSGPRNGTLGVVKENRVLYTPDANYTGIDSFTWKASDGFWDSVTATVSITIGIDCLARFPHQFHGNVTIDGFPAPANKTISVKGDGVRTGLTGNPVVTGADSAYGSDAGGQLLVQGCIVNGTPLTFSIDGLKAEVRDVNGSGPWQTAFPFQYGEVTGLDLRLESPPDTVYIDSLGITVSNASLGFYQSVQVEKNPWIQLRVSGGIFDIGISATGYHDFFDLPLLSRNATLGIYEGGKPVSKEVNVVFGSRTATFHYLAQETRTFDILISVDDQPEVHDVRQMTIFVGPDNEGTGVVGWSLDRNQQ